MICNKIRRKTENKKYKIKNKKYIKNKEGKKGMQKWIMLQYEFEGLHTA